MLIGSRQAFETIYGSSVISSEVRLPASSPAIASALPGTQQVCGPCTTNRPCPIHSKDAPKAAGTLHAFDANTAPSPATQTLGNIVGDFLDKLVDVVADRVTAKMAPLIAVPRTPSLSTDSFPFSFDAALREARQQSIDPTRAARDNELRVLKARLHTYGLTALCLVDDDELTVALVIVDSKTKCVVEPMALKDAWKDGCIRLQLTFNGETPHTLAPIEAALTSDEAVDTITNRFGVSDAKHSFERLHAMQQEQRLKAFGIEAVDDEDDDVER